MFDLIIAFVGLAFLVYVYIKMSWVGLIGVTLLCGAACLVTR